MDNNAHDIGTRKTPNGDGPGGSDGAPRIPDHELMRRIGRGSYGEIWLAKNIMGTYRAVKLVYRKNFENQRPYDREFDGIKKFEPISRTHEGLVDVLQMGKNDASGYFYYVMELADDEVSGQTIHPDTYRPKTLDSELKCRHQLPFEECLELALSLTSAMGHLHEHSLVHRDIKPSNIIFVHGLPKLADIGLVTDVGAKTIPGGTLGYIAPEGLASRQADIYSLGKVIYEISTGRDRQEFPELPSLLHQMDDQEKLLELNEVVVKACALDPHHRYQSAGEMQAELELLLGGKSVKRLRFLERRLAILTRVGMAAALLLVLGAGAYYQNYRIRKQAAQRLARTYVGNGTRAVRNQNFFDALLWYAEALQLEKGDLERERSYRMHLAVTLRQCPKLAGMWPEKASVNDVAFSPDGRYLASGGADGVIVVRNARSGEKIHSLAGHRDEVESVTFSPDSRYLASGSLDHTARVWDLATGRELIPPLEHPGMVYSVRFHPTGTRLLTACSDSRVRIWDLDTRQAREFSHHTDVVRFATFSPDGRRFASASQDATAQVWSVDGGEKPLWVIHSKSWIYRVAFSPDGRYVVAACFENEAKALDTQSSQIQTLQHDQAVRSVDFSPDGRYLLTACWDYSLRLWDVTNWRLAGPVLNDNAYVMAGAFSPDGRRVLTGNVLGLVKLWDLTTYNWLPPTVRRYYNPLGSVYATPDANGVQLWNATNDLPLVAMNTSHPAESIRFNAAGDRLVTRLEETRGDGRTNHWLQIWNSVSGRPQSPPLLCQETLGDLSSDGSRLVTYLGATAHLWDATAGRRLGGDLTQTAPIASSVFSPQADLLVTRGETNAVVWNTSDGSQRRGFQHAGIVNATRFSPDGRRLLAAYEAQGLSGSEAVIWDVETGLPLGRPFPHRDGVLDAQFNPDGKLVATASEDKTAQIWVAATGKRLASLPHAHEVLAVAFSEDGAYLASVCRDRTIRVWNVETGEPLTPPLRHLKMIVGAQFIANHEAVLSQVWNGECSLWRLPSDDRPAQDLARLARLLSCQQSDLVAGSLFLDKDTLMNLWNELRPRYPADFETAPAEVEAWDEREAANHEAAHFWSGALFHLDRLLMLRPDDPALRERRRSLQAKLAAAGESQTPP
jgi:WD40 repeat protein